MKIKIEKRPGVTEICLFGELGHHEAIDGMAEIRDEIEREFQKEIVLDMKGLTFMDSSGIAVVMKAYKCVQQLGGKMSVRVEQGHKRRILSAAGLEKIMEII